MQPSRRPYPDNAITQPADENRRLPGATITGSAEVAELADAPDSKSGPRHGGNPVSPVSPLAGHARGTRVAPPGQPGSAGSETAPLSGTIVGEAPVMKAMLYTHVAEGQYRQTELFETVLPPLVNAAPASHFEF